MIGKIYIYICLEVWITSHDWLFSGISYLEATSIPQSVGLLETQWLQGSSIFFRPSLERDEAGTPTTYCI